MTTHLPNGLAPKMGGAPSGRPMPTTDVREVRDVPIKYISSKIIKDLFDTHLYYCYIYIIYLMYCIFIKGNFSNRVAARDPCWIC